MTWMSLFNPNLYLLVYLSLLMYLKKVGSLLQRYSVEERRVFCTVSTRAKSVVEDICSPSHQFFLILEAFAVCENYSPPKGFNPKDLHRLLEKVGSPWGGDDQDRSIGRLEGPNKVDIPFLACGDLNGYDSDRSYPLPKVADGI